MIRDFQRDAKAGGRSGKTCNGYLKDVGSAFSLAVKDGLLLSNPVAGVEPLPESDSLRESPLGH